MYYQSHIINEDKPYGVSCLVKEGEFVIFQKIAELVLVEVDEEGNSCAKSKSIIREFKGWEHTFPNIVALDFENYIESDPWFLCQQGVTEFKTIWESYRYCFSRIVDPEYSVLEIEEILRRAGVHITTENLPKEIEIWLNAFSKDYIQGDIVLSTEKNNKYQTFIQLFDFINDWEVYYESKGLTVNFSFKYCENSKGEVAQKCVERANSIKNMDYDLILILNDAIGLAKEIGKGKRAKRSDLMANEDTRLLMCEADTMIEQGWIEISKDGTVTVNDSLAYYVDYN